ncbi:ArgS-related anticodon-binding protein NrtL [Streptomyces albicerus]|uniref:ArgS-related anticodon-binding protein NrtL n=1 Tax=Streptomyces albicerus TaxID=2569859 RepID=UPI00124B75A4|nr:DALR anticodon-binding domain-containing protein [Streptomyces albicerus]
MTPVELSRTVLRAVRRAVDAGELTAPVPERALVAPPGPGGRGDYATNVALQLARPAGRPSREVAEILRAHITDAEGVTKVEITGPGFLNITLDGRAQALVAEILRRGEQYGYGYGYGYGAGDKSTGELVQLHYPCEVRAAVTGQVVARILRSQGALVRTSCEAEPDPAWAEPLGVTVVAHGRPGAAAPLDTHGKPSAPTPLTVNLRPVPAPEDPTPLGRDAARWALLHPAPHDHPRITADHLVQRETNPLFRVRYAHARTRALTRNAAALGFTSTPGDVEVEDVEVEGIEVEDVDADGDASRAAGSAHGVLDALAAYPHALAAAARHRGPDRLARHLVTTADAMLAFQHTVLPLGDEKPSAAHRARLALAEAAGTVLAGGLTLLGIDAPEHL